jgi:hypothetical protein
MTRTTLSLGLVSLLAACGGGGGSVDCTFEACGGDPVGTWTVAESCVEFGDFENPFCPEWTINTFDFALSGTLTIADDDTYTSNFTNTVTFSYTLPASCLPPGLTSCEELEDEDSDETCTGDVSEACTCSGTDVDSVSDSGTWATSGNTLTLDGDDALEYCVDGDVLKVRDSDDDVEAVFVFTR